MHEPLGIAPIKLVSEFPKDTPVVFITSKIDEEVPYECTKNLAQALANAGHNEVYIIELEKSRHSWYAMDNAQDIELYLTAMHAIYKHYELPYIEEYASKAQPIEKFLVSKIQ